MPFDKSNAVSLSSEIKTNNVRVLDDAEIPGGPIYPRTRANMQYGVFGSLGSFGVFALLAALWPDGAFGSLGVFALLLLELYADKDFARFERQPVVVDHDQRAVPLHHGALLG